METTFKLTGKKAVIALVAVVAALAFQFMARSQTLQTEAVQKIKLHLVGEYTRHYLPEIQEAALNESFTEARADEIVRQLSADNIEIVSINARGFKGRYVVRVEVTVDGSPPPDGKPVRYFRMKHSLAVGWRLGAETAAWRYHLPI